MADLKALSPGPPPTSSVSPGQTPRAPEKPRHLSAKPRCPLAGHAPLPPPHPQAPSTHPSSGPWTIPAHHRGTAPARWTGPPWILPGIPAASASHRRSASREAGRGEGMASLLGQGPLAPTLNTPSPSPAQGWSPECFQS